MPLSHLAVSKIATYLIAVQATAASSKHYKPVAEFKEFERRFKFKPRFKYGWFHLKLYQMFQDLSRR